MAGTGASLARRTMVLFLGGKELLILQLMSQRLCSSRSRRAGAWRNAARLPAFLLAGGFWLAGCAVQVQSNWQDKASHDQTFKKVLVVGMSPNFTQRCDFEFSLVSHIRSSAVTPIASCDLMTSKDELTRENIVRV